MAMRGSESSAVLLRGGRIWTGDPRVPRAEALLWYRDTLEAVGSEEEVRSHPLASRARVISLGGESVLPGLTDAHAHLAFYAKQRHAVPLDRCSSLEDVKRLLRERSAAVPPDSWICGVRFNDTQWEEKRLPTRQDLDALGVPNPVLLSRICCHVQVANSRGLAAAGFPPDAVPSVMGLGMRSAVEAFAAQGIVPVIKGKGGFVVRQTPEPGSPWPDGRKECILWLEERTS